MLLQKDITSKLEQIDIEAERSSKRVEDAVAELQSAEADYKDLAFKLTAEREALKAQLSDAS